jgi:hypothetical protein
MTIDLVKGPDYLNKGFEVKLKHGSVKKTVRRPFQDEVTLKLESLTEPMQATFLYDNDIVGKGKIRLPKTSESKPTLSKTREVKSKLDIDGKSVPVVLDFNLDVESSGFNKEKSSKKTSSKYKKASNTSEYSYDKYGSSSKKSPKKKSSRRNRDQEENDSEDEDYGNDSKARNNKKKSSNARRSKDDRSNFSSQFDNDSDFGGSYAGTRSQARSGSKRTGLGTGTGSRGYSRSPNRLRREVEQLRNQPSMFGGSSFARDPRANLQTDLAKVNEMISSE